MSFQSSSSFRRSGQRDDRRRRLLADELVRPGDWSTGPAGSAEARSMQRSEHYGDAEFLEQQLRLFDLIPRRIVGLAVVLAVGAVMLVGLVVTYGWMLKHSAGQNAMPAALDLGVKGSLGCWFSSILLLASAVAAILIYAVRRHRVDDYQGRYRIWLSAAACWFLAATDQAASLREGFRDVMIALTGTPIVGNGDFWWVIFYLLVLGAVGSRLLVDMRSCRLALVALAGAAAAHCLAVAVRLGWMLPPIGNQEVMFVAGAEMAGNLMLLATMLFYARHVLLDAEGLLPRSDRELDEDDEEDLEEVEARESSSGGRWRSFEPPHSTPAPVFQRTAAPLPAASNSAPPLNRKLTKGERKALKDRLLREREARGRSG